LDREQFFRSWLVAFLFWLALPLGCLGVLMLQYQTGGLWGVAMRRVLESATQTLPLLALAFVPVALGMHYLYVWTDLDALELSGALSKHELELLRHKEPYLNIPFFLARAAFYFAVWIGIAYRLHRWSVSLERDPDPRALRRREVFSGAGILFSGLTLTF